MITKEDCILLLTELENSGVNVSNALTQCVLNDNIDIEVIRFIDNNRQFEASKFYQKLRKSYNDKHSKLYINLVREEQKTPDDILTTLASLNLQILLYSQTVEDKVMFLRHMRFEEICQALLVYSKTYNLTACNKLLTLIKADLKCFEYFAKDRT